MVALGCGIKLTDSLYDSRSDKSTESVAEDDSNRAGDVNRKRSHWRRRRKDKRHFKSKTEGIAHSR